MVRGLGSQSQGTCTFGSPGQKFRKGERSRRMWTLREEEILASTLLELVHVVGNPTTVLEPSIYRKSKIAFVQNSQTKTLGGIRMSNQRFTLGKKATVVFVIS
ncbi:hypothetical protein SASPL_101662 [Salvia splendens]|uniref:Uncharacterized protein n=1 Tax=Salvia splendens TaxID=180675 RepID=A0A8X8YV93_SALSN|nr:hypothetical protein SASPL_101662 [Salvia splendens]